MQAQYPKKRISGGVQKELELIGQKTVEEGVAWRETPSKPDLIWDSLAAERQFCSEDEEVAFILAKEKLALGFPGRAGSVAAMARLDS